MVRQTQIAPKAHELRGNGSFFRKKGEANALPPFFHSTRRPGPSLLPSVGLQKPLQRQACEDYDPRKKADVDKATCYTPPPASLPATCAFTSTQKQLLQIEKDKALGYAERALHKLTASAKSNRLAVQFTQYIFEFDVPDGQELVAKLKAVQQILSGTQIQFQGATCKDVGCERNPRGNNEAYVTGPGQMPIYICPRAFLSPGRLYATILHEAFHLAGVIPATANEVYCLFDCLNPCSSKNAADAWANYTICLDKVPITSGSVRSLRLGEWVAIPDSEQEPTTWHAVGKVGAGFTRGPHSIIADVWLGPLGYFYTANGMHYPLPEDWRSQVKGKSVQPPLPTT